MASRIQIGKTVTVDGKQYRIRRSTRSAKKYEAVPVNGLGPSVHFGQSGAHARPGTQKGDSYCARSAGIQSGPRSANAFSRMLWNCEGDKSYKR